MMPNGYTGKILHVDLTSGTLDIEEPPEAFYRKFLGGSAMGMHYILKGMAPNEDALGPHNILTLMVSVLTGAPISGQSRLTASAKSPLVDGIGDSQCGGFFPAELKFAGFDGIVVKGRSAKPVYLWIKDGEAELRDASHLWGQTTHEAETMLKKELGDDKVEVMQVGPAGEKMVRVAAIMNMSNRANGRAITINTPTPIKPPRHEQIRSITSAKPPRPCLASSFPSNVAAAEAGVPGMRRYVAGMSPAKIAVKLTPIISAKPAFGSK